MLLGEPGIGKTAIVEGLASRMLDDDIAEFSMWRLRFGIKWWEDIVKYNNHSDYYKEETLEKYPVKW